MLQVRNFTYILRLSAVMEIPASSAAKVLISRVSVHMFVQPGVGDGHVTPHSITVAPSSKSADDKEDRTFRRNPW